jgi:hypothetical protein
MSGENSTKITSGGGGSVSRTTVTSLQSPFYFPSSNVGSSDTPTFASGNSSLTPPWWFTYYTGGGCSGTCTHDLTGHTIDRTQASYNTQISSQKSSVIGILAKATFSGNVSYSSYSTPADLYQTFFFSERDDYAGQREIGFVRDQGVNTYYGNSYDITYAYWYTNDNCGVHTGVSTDPNMGYPTCRYYEATEGASETPSTAWSNGYLAATGINYVLLTGLSTGTQYNYRAWIFWASWDSTYKLRVEAWDSTFTTEIFASNVDTTNGTDSLNLTTSGTSGYFTIGTLRSDNPGGTAEMSGSGVELDVAQVQSITP